MRFPRITASLMCLVLLLGALLFGMTVPDDVHADRGERPSGHVFRPSERLTLIKQRGVLIVGVKTDYPPFGMLNGAGEPVGLEHDLAADIARRLGVKLRTVAVSGSNRLQKLQEGEVDLVIATVGDTAERRGIATMIEPSYYASGATLFMPPRATIQDWADTRGKKVCAIQGAYFNRAMQQHYRFDLRLYDTVADAGQAVRDGRCIGLLFDNTAITADLAKPEWQGYKTPLPPVMTTPWVMAIATGEQGSTFEKILGDIVADWHRSGFLIEREKAWKITPSKFLGDAHDLWRRKGADGAPFCRRGPDGRWNAECRTTTGLQPVQSQPDGHLFTPSERLALIKQRGVLIVGIKTDYPPFGMLNAAGEPIGFEHDLAADVARRLGVGLKKVGVTGSNRLQKLQEGVIDLVIATTGDTADRRKIATMIEPDYYASGVTLFMSPRGNIKDWTDMRGKTVCAAQGSYYNRTMQQRYLLDLLVYNNARDAKLAVRDGRCIGFLFDNTAIMNDLTKPEWQGYKAPLPPVLVTPWAMAIAAKERGSEFEKLLGDIAADWHRSGFLIEREKAWNIPPSKFLADAHDLWRKKGAGGQPFCKRGPDGAWNAECRNKVFLTSTDVGGLAQLGLWLNERTGINLTLVYDAFDRRMFLLGLATTLGLTVLCIFGSLGFGLVGALLAESRVPLLPALTRAGRELARMTPPLPSMYVVLFGIGSVCGRSLPAMGVVVWCLSVYTGAAIMTAFLDAAATYRLQHPDYRLRLSQVRHVVRLASGSVTASLINVSKSTMMASAFAVPELMSVTTSIISERGNVGVMMNAMLVTFLLIVFCVVRLLGRLERHLTRERRHRPRPEPPASPAVEQQP